MKTVKIKIADMQIQCPCQSEKWRQSEGRIVPTTVMNNNSPSVEFPYTSNFTNGLNTRGRNARLSWYCNWGDVTVLRGSISQVRWLTCFLWDFNISKGTTLRSTKASSALNNSSRAVATSMYAPTLPKRHHCYCGDSCASFYTEKASLKQ